MVKKHIAEPIKSKKDIKAVEQYLKEDNERDYNPLLFSYLERFLPFSEKYLLIHSL